MRVFTSLYEAGSEIQRDLAKGIAIDSSRVQQHVGLKLKGRERVGYEYGILGGIPDHPHEIVKLGQTLQMKLYVDHPDEMEEWLASEMEARCFWEAGSVSMETYPLEIKHPYLKSTIEGNWPAYTYPERLSSAMNVLMGVLERDPDSRRAYWPIFQPLDSLRAVAPTRVPCSIGYSLMLRNLDGEQKLIMTYLQRACDFDNFWLSDVYLAHAFQKEASERIINVKPGLFIHFIVSLHSFEVGDQEIY